MYTDSPWYDMKRIVCSPLCPWKREGNVGYAHSIPPLTYKHPETSPSASVPLSTMRKGQACCPKVYIGKGHNVILSGDMRKARKGPHACYEVVNIHDARNESP